MAAVIAFLTNQLDDAALAGSRLTDWRAANYELLSSIKDLELGQKGYLLTGEQRYLDQQNEAAAKIPAQLKAVQELSPADEAHQALLNRAVVVIRHKLDEIKTTTELKSQGKTDDAIAIVKVPENRDSLIAVKRDFTTVANYLTANLKDIRTTSTVRRQQLVASALAALVLSALLGIAAILAVRMQLNVLRASQTQLTMNNEMLEQLVKERTDSLEKASQEVQREKDQIEALLAEVNHRVGNSMQIVSSFLGLQAERIQNPEAREALESARSRVQAIATAQRRLRLTSAADIVEVNVLLENLVSDIRSALAEDKRIDITVKADPASASSNVAITIGVILTEVVNNALKHAFPGDRPGHIQISLHRGENGAPAKLMIEDNGVGMPGTAEKHKGFGMEVVRALAASLQASVTTEPVQHDGPNKGARVVLTFPVERAA